MDGNELADAVQPFLDRHQPPAEEPPSNSQQSLESYEKLLKSHAAVADLVQEIHRDLHTHVPGGFQAERLAEILEERHGPEKMAQIQQSLESQRQHSPYFREVQAF